MKAKLQKVSAVRDESSHWYIIPTKEAKLFHDLHEQGCLDDNWGLFETKFGKYRTDGLNNIQLYAEI